MNYIFSQDDMMQPVYCIGCRVHIPKIVSNLNKGFCDDCIKNPTPPPIQVYQPVNNTNTLITTTVVFVMLFFCCCPPLLWLKASRSVDSEPIVVQEKQPPTAYEIREAKEKAERDAQELKYKQWVAREEALRGKMPVASPWDGITPEANRYLFLYLNDYDSMQIIMCSDVYMHGDYAWGQRVRYRANNLFGTKIIKDQMFVIKNGRVIDVSDYN